MISSMDYRKKQRRPTGLGLCIPGWDDFGTDSGRLEEANRVYRELFNRDLPERVAGPLRDNEDICDRSEIYEYVKARPPTSRDIPASEILEEREEQAEEAKEKGLGDTGFTPPPPVNEGLPPWALPAVGGILVLGVAAAVLMKKKPGKK